MPRTPTLLLFDNSKTFPNATLLNSIRQSIIELKLEHSKEQLRTLLNNALQILDTNLNKYETEEISILISQCLSAIGLDTNLFEQIFSNVYKNATRLYSFAIVLENLRSWFLKSNKELISGFLARTAKQIYHNIKHSSIFAISDEQNGLSVNIPDNYQADFISYIILSGQQSDKVVTFFYPYLLSRPLLSSSRKAKFVERLSNPTFSELITEELLIQNQLLDKLPINIISSILPKLSEKTFIELLPAFKLIIEANSSNSVLLQGILDNCVKYNVSFNMIKIDNYFDQFTATMIKPHYWKYFASNNVILPNDLINDIDNFPDDPSIIKILPSLNYISPKTQIKSLSTFDELALFEKIAQNRKSFDDYEFEESSQINFWIHVISVISNSNQKYSHELFLVLKELFLCNVDSRNIYPFFEEMIFTNLSKNHHGFSFLYDLLNSFSPDYQSYFAENSVILLTKILDMEIVPPSLFWNLFDFNFIQQFYQEENSNPIILLAYNYLNPSKNSNLARIPSSLSKSSQDTILQFIHTYDFDYLAKSNIELSLFSQAIEIYIKQFEKPLVEGLTEETVLPFVVLSLFFIEEYGGNLLFDSEIEDMFIKRVKNASYDKFDIELVNTLLSFDKLIFNDSIFPLNAAFETFNIVINQYIDQTFEFDKSALFASLFLNTSNLLVQSIFQRHGLQLFQFFLNNPSLAVDLSPFRFDLSVLNHQKRNKMLIEHFSRRHLTKAKHACFFLTNYCANIPNIKLNKGDLLHQFLTKEYSNQSSVFLSYSVPPKEQFAESSFMTILAESIIKRTRNEKSTIGHLLRSFMKDESISACYATLILEKCTKDDTVSDSDLAKYDTQYSSYLYAFCNSIRHCYRLSESTLIRNYQYPITNYYSPSVHLNSINYLLSCIQNNESTYQAIYSLNKVALAFPFLFIPDSLACNPFDTITPLLNSFSLLYTDNLDHHSKMIALLAQSFFYSISYSVEVLNCLLDWIFRKLPNFTQSQVLAFTFLLDSYASVEKIRDAFLIYASKYNFPRTAFKLLDQPVSFAFRDMYTTNLFTILDKYYSLLYDSNNDKLQLLSALVDEPDQIPTLIFNNYLTIYPLSLPQPQLNIDFPENEKAELYQPIDLVGSSQLNDNNHMNINHIILEKTNRLKHQLFNDNLEIWKQYRFTLRSISNQIYKGFFPNISNNSILFLIKAAFGNYSTPLSLLSTLLKHKSFYRMCYPSLKSFISQNDDTERMFKVLTYIHSKLNTESNTSDISDLLINLALTPEIRNNPESFKQIITIIGKTKHKLPPCTTLLLELYLIQNQKDDINLSQVLDICIFIGTENLANVLPLLEKLFDSYQNFSLNTSNMDLLIKLIRVIPSICKNQEVWKVLLNHYFRGLGDADSFIDLFNAITPEKDDTSNTDNETDLSLVNSTQNVSNHTPYHNNYIIPQIPSAIYQKNPEFWDIYECCSDFINKILMNNISNFAKFKFLTLYSQLLTFDSRLKIFRRSIDNRLKRGRQLPIYVSRKEILRDSFNQMQHIPNEEWFLTFRVSFQNEHGIDCGGLTKEWFTLIIQKIFDPGFALFQLTENNTYKPNPFSNINENHLEYFSFAGKVVARAILQKECISAHLTPSFLRRILNTNVRLTDYEDIDKTTYNSLKTILEGDNAEELYLTFVTTNGDLDGNRTIPLIENGENIDVTNENKHEYVRLYVDYHLRKSINDQITAFCNGFYSIIPLEFISSFTITELDILMCGPSQIDINDMKNNTAYSWPYHLDHPTIKMFYRVISKWTQDNLTKLIKFVTGSSRIPVNGFKDYRETGYPFKITQRINNNSLCTAHTCFNTLDLPNYQNEKTMNEKLLFAINECNYFGLA